MTLIEKGTRIAVTGIKNYEDVKDQEIDDVAKKVAQYVRNTLVLNSVVKGEIEVDAMFSFIQEGYIRKECVTAQMVCDENFNIVVNSIQWRAGNWIIESKTYN